MGQKKAKYHRRQFWGEWKSRLVRAALPFAIRQQGGGGMSNERWLVDVYDLQLFPMNPHCLPSRSMTSGCN